jgi:hexosaminidase
VKVSKRSSTRTAGMAALLSLTLAIPMLAGQGAVAAEDPPPPRDLALEGVAVAASEFPDPARFAAAFANDGDPSTRWGSDYMHGDEEPSYPHSDHDPTNDWITIELAEPSEIARVTFNWQDAYARRYDVQVSTDGAAWTTVAAIEDGRAGIREIDVDVDGPVSFVRMQGREASPWGYSLFSFEVWDRVTEQPAPDPTEWDYGTDVAQFADATAASVYTGNPGRFAAANAVDDNSGTRWGSDYPRDGVVEPPASSHDPSADWLQVELSEPSPVWSVAINWETARPAKYLVQTSTDGTTWTTVKEQVGVAPGRIEHILGLKEPVSFVRMQGVTPATGFGYSIWDFEVWSGPKAPPAPGGEVLPAPVSLTALDGEPFELGPKTRIVASDRAAAAEAEKLAADLRPATGFELPVTTRKARDGDISLVLADVAGAGDSELARAEGYELVAASDGLTIEASAAHGLFNGGRTLLQLLPAEITGDVVRPGPWTIEPAEIIDYPRYEHRGVMLDPARNFIEPDGVRDIIDAVADMKGNRLHMHLSDDQGWRIEIESWPRLAEVGGAGSMPGGVSGYYTQEQFSDLVAYAADRHVEVIPEIDLPGHSSAAIAAYPELSCGSSNTVCTTSETVDRFINDVIAEVGALTPSEFFHIGGDESISGQPYIDFIKKLEGFVMDHDKRMVGWTPLPMADLDESSVHQYWRDQSFEMEPWWFDNENQVILSPTAHAYLDYPYPSFNTRATYDWDPTHVIDDYLSLSLQSFGLKDENVIGIEGPAWGENNHGGAPDVEHKVFPRLAALLDLAWSPKERTEDPDSFFQRLALQGPRWQFSGTNFWPDPEVGWTSAAAGTVFSGRDSRASADDDAPGARAPVRPGHAGRTLTVDGSVATIASPTCSLGSLTATIDWGDGTTSEGVLTGSDAAGKLGNSLFEVSSTHRYSQNKGVRSWTGAVAISGPEGCSWEVPIHVSITNGRPGPDGD